MAYVVMAEAGGLFVIEDLNMAWGPFGLRDENNQARTHVCLPACKPMRSSCRHAHVQHEALLAAKMLL